MGKQLCKIEGCEKLSKARQLCWMHYGRVRSGIEDMRLGHLPWKPDDPRYEKKTWFCGVPECFEKHFAKGLCRNHYELNRRKGNLIYHKDIPKPECSVFGCHNLATSLASGLCRFHRERKMRNVPLNRPKGVKGVLNHNWNGGVADYPNHYKMKKMRSIVLKEANYKCFYCGKPTYQIHHKDQSKDNHTRDNIVACCGSCNCQQERSKIRTSKFKRLYGKTLQELADTLKICIPTVVARHKQGKLTAYIRQDIQYYLSVLA